MPNDIYTPPRQNVTTPSTIPIQVATVALGTVSAIIGGSWSVIEPAHHVTPPASSLIVRLAFVAFGANAGDVVSVKLANAAGGDLTTEASTLAVDANAVLVTTPWIAAPPGHTSTLVWARNQTAARGTVAAAWLEFASI